MATLGDEADGRDIYWIVEKERFAGVFGATSAWR